MLTPMLVQYLVGLCCLRNDPDAVEIILGDMVLDKTAEEERDIDVTVTVKETGGSGKGPFRAYEVKNEKRTLDVATVEQLCAKLCDMPDITHRAIVSASGYTETARKKAKKAGVELLTLSRWDKPLDADLTQFSLSGPPEECLIFSRELLCWDDYSLHVEASNAPPSFTVRAEDRILRADGSSHKQFQTFAAFSHEMLLRSTEDAVKQFSPDPQALQITSHSDTNARMQLSLRAENPPGRYSYAMEISEDGAYLKLDGKHCLLNTFSVEGRLEWQKDTQRPQYFAIRNDTNGGLFAGAMIALGKREGEMFGFVLSPTSLTAGVHFVKLTEKQKNMLRKLRIEIPAST